MSVLLTIIQALRTERSLFIWNFRSMRSRGEACLIFRCTVETSMIWSFHRQQILVQDITNLALYFEVGSCIAFVVLLGLFSDLDIQIGLTIQELLVNQSMWFAYIIVLAFSRDQSLIIPIRAALSLTSFWPTPGFFCHLADHHSSSWHLRFWLLHLRLHSDVSRHQVFDPFLHSIRETRIPHLRIHGAAGFGMAMLFMLCMRTHLCACRCCGILRQIVLISTSS